MLSPEKVATPLTAASVSVPVSAPLLGFVPIATVMFPVNPVAAATFYGQLPAALRRVPGTARDQLLQIFQIAGPTVAASLAEIVPVVGEPIPRKTIGV